MLLPRLITLEQFSVGLSRRYGKQRCPHPGRTRRSAPTSASLAEGFTHPADTSAKGGRPYACPWSKQIAIDGKGRTLLDVLPLPCGTPSPHHNPEIQVGKINASAHGIGLRVRGRIFRGRDERLLVFAFGQFGDAVPPKQGG